MGMLLLLMVIITTTNNIMPYNKPDIIVEDKKGIYFLLAFPREDVREKGPDKCWKLLEA
jgi:hypothetical protein